MLNYHIRLLCTASIFLVMLVEHSMAASLGGSGPDVTGESGNFSLGLEYDNLIDREVKLKSGTETLGGNMVFSSCNCNSIDYPMSGDKAYSMKTKYNQLLITGAIALHDRVDLFAKVGLSAFNFKYTYSNNPSTGMGEENHEFEGDYGIALGAGVKGKILDAANGTKFILSAGAMTYESDGDYKINGSDISGTISPAGVRINSYTSTTKVTQWHLAALLMRKFKILVPYCGIKYSSLTFKNDTVMQLEVSSISSPFDRTITLNVEADKNVGVFGGLNFNINERFSAGTQLRLVDEAAVSISANYIF